MAEKQKLDSSIKELNSSLIDSQDCKNKDSFK